MSHEFSSAISSDFITNNQRTADDNLMYPFHKSAFSNWNGDELCLLYLSDPSLSSTPTHKSYSNRLRRYTCCFLSFATCSDPTLIHRLTQLGDDPQCNVHGFMLQRINNAPTVLYCTCFRKKGFQQAHSKSIYSNTSN